MSFTMKGTKTMSLDKAIRYGKEHRKPYKKAKAVDSSCRNHGTCAFCRSNRTHKVDKTELSVKQAVKDFKEHE